MITKYPAITKWRAITKQEHNKKGESSIEHSTAITRAITKYPAITKWRTQQRSSITKWSKMEQRRWSKIGDEYPF